jgi:hypothetical protein
MSPRGLIWCDILFLKSHLTSSGLFGTSTTPALFDEATTFKEELLFTALVPYLKNSDFSIVHHERAPLKRKGPASPQKLLKHALILFHL